MFNGEKVYLIDGVQTIIHHIRGNIAKGFILNSDLTLQSCFIVKSGKYFAHGKTAHEAYKAVIDKSILNEPVEKRIDRFLAEHKTSIPYSARDLFDWHHRLTGSCKMGREAFCRDKGIDVDNDSFTVEEFVKITCNAYGADVIRKLAEKLDILLD